MNQAFSIERCPLFRGSFIRGLVYHVSLHPLRRLLLSSTRGRKVAGYCLQRTSAGRCGTSSSPSQNRPLRKVGKPPLPFLIPPPSLIPSLLPPPPPSHAEWEECQQCVAEKLATTVSTMYSTALSSAIQTRLVS